VLKLNNQLFFFVFLLFASSCQVYKQDILLQIPKKDRDLMGQAVFDAERNYQIQANDWLKINLYTNEGEQLIDPNYLSPNQSTSLTQQSMQLRDRFQYLVQFDGKVKLPMVGTVTLEGMTIQEAEIYLQQKYDAFYKGSFIKLQYLNKRVVVLGAQNMVVPLENENMTILEVIALSGGIMFGNKAQNIRLVRGDLSDPQVFEIDLSTVQGMRMSALSVNPGDIIYIEPWRRPWLETLRDISPVLGITSSVSTLVFLLITTLKG